MAKKQRLKVPAIRKCKRCGNEFSTQWSNYFFCESCADAKFTAGRHHPSFKHGVRVKPNR